jgi:ABC-type transport system involved in multi-copper enzyme maturation permease subunit
VDKDAAVVHKKRREANPLLVKELRGRMRGARAFVVLSVYLLLLSCFTTVVYYAYVSSASGYGGSEMAYLGKVVFYTVALIELFMVVFITPAFTTGALSGERERKTYELLRATLLPARKLVSGKLTAALTFMCLLILAAVPLEGLAFMLGGVAVEELALALILLLVATFTFASLGLFLSAVARTTLAATVWTYAVALLVTVGLPLLLLVFGGLVVDSILVDASSWLWQAILYYLMILVASLSPISAAVLSEVFLVEQGDLLYQWVDLTYSLPGPSSYTPRRILVPSPWIVYTVIYVLLGLVLLLATVARVRRQAKE